ncbi:MAG: phosphoglucosamine mutase [Candidatus Micrarchaeota archaeon]|nr:phosphoglucosamine mutase [Candidatus Micrarchaeota archaeon]
MGMGLFGTNGVRGTIDKLTPMLAFDLAAAFASRCEKGKIALARDMRLTSPLLHSAVLAGIMYAGRDAVDFGLVSSPVAEYAHHKAGTTGLIIVTASHNPPEWNALKFVDENGVAISAERGEAIEKSALSKAYYKADWMGVGGYEEKCGATEQHAKACLEALDAEKIRKGRLRVALDFGNGTSSLSSSLFSSLGCEVIALNEKLDGNFPGRLSEPSEQNVQRLLGVVRENSCDFGVAWDGDSDRVIFVDENGRWIVGDRGFAISAKRACQEAAESGKKDFFVVTTVATSRAVEESCAPFGAKTIYTKVGAPYLSEKMRELSGLAVSGGEEVGGIIWPSFSLAKDGIFAAAKMCELVCERKLSELVSELPLYYNSKSKPQISPERKREALEAAKKHAEGMEGGRLTLVDGVRVDLEDGWAIVRASGTENALRIFAEGKTQKRAEQLRREFEDALSGMIG